MKKAQGKIHIGTSGFSYKHWRNDFYPAGLKPQDYLAYYSTHFSTTEINASFYRLPDEATVAKWAAQVPEGFLFCPKMSRYLTHMKKLREPEEPLARFFSVFEPMKDKLGPVLIQLPDRLHFKPDVAQHFYEALLEKYAHYRFALEIRHQSWLSEESLAMMEDYSVGLVISQSGVEIPYSEKVTAPHIYVRFHGPRELYASAYSDEKLAEYAAKFLAWTKSGHTVWAYFNNDIHGYAPVDAARLKALVQDGVFEKKEIKLR